MVGQVAYQVAAVEAVPEAASILHALLDRPYDAVDPADIIAALQTSLTELAGDDLNGEEADPPSRGGIGGAQYRGGLAEYREVARLLPGPRIEGELARAGGLLGSFPQTPANWSVDMPLRSRRATSTHWPGTPTMSAKLRSCSRNTLIAILAHDDDGTDHDQQENSPIP